MAENLTGSEMGNRKQAEGLKKQLQTGIQDREEGKTELPPLFPILPLVKRCVKMSIPRICKHEKQQKE